MLAKRWFMKMARRWPVSGSSETCMMPVVGTAFHICRSIPSTADRAMPLSATGTLSKNWAVCWRKVSSIRRPLRRLLRRDAGMFSRMAPTASSLHPASMVGMRSKGPFCPGARLGSPTYCVPSKDSGRSMCGHSTYPFTLCSGTLPKHCEMVLREVQRAQGRCSSHFVFDLRHGSHARLTRSRLRRCAALPPGPPNQEPSPGSPPSAPSSTGSSCCLFMLWCRCSQQIETRSTRAPSSAAFNPSGAMSQQGSSKSRC
mmetsp:Transcript_10689/g.25476  ORF Transcript_10689/g.25476 Transcript_10689/m.25476 type:complete len:257 (-) Transcript_10689:61-831(-)